MKKYKFDAEIQAGRGGGAYVVFPYDTEKEFGTKGKVPVNATIDGIADRGGLFTMGKPFHMMGVPKAIREQIGKAPGDIVSVVLWKDEQPPEEGGSPTVLPESELHQPEGILPVDHRSQEGRNADAAAGEGP